MVSTAELLVVDDSVAVKWYLPDETDVALARALLIEFARGQVQLAAPQHIRAEVPSAISVASRGRDARITAAQSAGAIGEFLALGLPTHDDDALITAAYAAAQQVGCAFYDGLYLALAQRLGVRLILADDRFHALIRHLPFVVQLADYQRTA